MDIDCGSHGITQALLHAMRASIEFARARVLQASQRMTAVTPFAIGAHGRSCGAEKERLPHVSEGDGP